MKISDLANKERKKNYKEIKEKDTSKNNTRKQQQQKKQIKINF